MFKRCVYQKCQQIFLHDIKFMKDTQISRLRCVILEDNRNQVCL